MANYNETTVSGSEYTRCNQVNIINRLGSIPAVIFCEERVAVLSDGRNLFTPLDHITEVFDPAKVINLIDPNTGLPTGVEATYGDVYIMLYSAYMDAALARDAAAVP